MGYFFVLAAATATSFGAFDKTHSPTALALGIFFAICTTSLVGAVIGHGNR